MPDKSLRLTRFGIFLAVGYLCAGIVVTILASIPYWTHYFESDFLSAISGILISMLVSGALGILAMRYLVKRYGVKAVLEQDVLILMIGLLFITLTINKAMLLVGLIVTSGALAVYFFENIKAQVKAIQTGGLQVFALCGWALGPVACLAIMFLGSSFELLIIRLIFAHFIVLAFWVWVQRLGLHTDYSHAPESLKRLQLSYQQNSSKTPKQGTRSSR